MPPSIISVTFIFLLGHELLMARNCNFLISVSPVHSQGSQQISAERSHAALAIQDIIRESCPERCPAPSLHPSTTPGLPHLKDVLNDLLLIMESCLQLLHIELEQVQRGGACGGGREGGLAGGSFPRPGGGVEDRTREWGAERLAGQEARPEKGEPGCLTRLAQHVGKADISADSWVQLHPGGHRVQLPCLVQLVQEGLSRERPVIGRVRQRERQSQGLGRKRGDGRERPGQSRLRKCSNGGRDEELQMGRQRAVKMERM